MGMGVWYGSRSGSCSGLSTGFGFIYFDVICLIVVDIFFFSFDFGESEREGDCTRG